MAFGVYLSGTVTIGIHVCHKIEYPSNNQEGSRGSIIQRDGNRHTVKRDGNRHTVKKRNTLDARWSETDIPGSAIPSQRMVIKCGPLGKWGHPIYIEC